MKVKDIMTGRVVCATPEMEITEAASLLFQNGFHGMPVVEKGKIVGMITENDFFSKTTENTFLPSYIKYLSENKVAENIPGDKKDIFTKLLRARVRDIMTRGCVTIAPDAEIMELLELIRQTRFNTIPVADEEKNIIGVVTLVDAIGLIGNNRKEILNLFNSGIILSNKRETDDLADNLEGFWKKKFLLIRKKEIKTWKSMLIIAFIAGVTAVFIWNVSIRIKTEIANDASSFVQQ